MERMIVLKATMDIDTVAKIINTLSSSLLLKRSQSSLGEAC